MIMMMLAMLMMVPHQFSTSINDHDPSYVMSYGVARFRKLSLLFSGSGIPCSASNSWGVPISMPPKVYKAVIPASVSSPLPTTYGAVIPASVGRLTVVDPSRPAMHRASGQLSMEIVWSGNTGRV